MSELTDRLRARPWDEADWEEVGLALVDRINRQESIMKDASKLISVFEAEVIRLREALRALYDEQVGPQLPGREKQWQEAMRIAEQAMILPEDPDA